MKKILLILLSFVIVMSVSAERFIPFENVEKIEIKQNECNEWKLFCSNQKKISVYYNGTEYAVCDLENGEKILETNFFEFPFFSAGFYEVKNGNTYELRLFEIKEEVQDVLVFSSEEEIKIEKCFMNNSFTVFFKATKDFYYASVDYNTLEIVTELIETGVENLDVSQKGFDYIGFCKTQDNQNILFSISDINGIEKKELEDFSELKKIEENEYFDWDVYFSESKDNQQAILKINKNLEIQTLEINEKVTQNDFVFVNPINDIELIQIKNKGKSKSEILLNGVVACNVPCSVASYAYYEISDDILLVLLIDDAGKVHFYTYQKDRDSIDERIENSKYAEYKFICREEKDDDENIYFLLEKKNELYEVCVNVYGMLIEKSVNESCKGVFTDKNIRKIKKAICDRTGKIIIELEDKIICINGMNDIQEIKSEAESVSYIINDVFYTASMNNNEVNIEKYNFN